MHVFSIAPIRETIAPYYVDITLAVITNISFSEAFEKIVEDKMIAEQEILKAENEKQKALVQAQQQLEVAKLEADAMIERTRVNAEAAIEEARAQAERIRIKSVETARMLGFEIVLDDEGKEQISFGNESDEQIKLLTE